MIQKGGVTNLGFWCGFCFRAKQHPNKSTQNPHKFMPKFTPPKKFVMPPPKKSTPWRETCLSCHPLTHQTRLDPTAHSRFGSCKGRSAPRAPFGALSSPWRHERQGEGQTNLLGGIRAGRSSPSGEGRQGQLLGHEHRAGRAPSRSSRRPSRTTART